MTARDFIARGLIRAGVSPNALTLTGMLLTGGAGVCYGLGAGSGRLAWSLAIRPGAASVYPLLAGGLLILSSACDMLDGAVARLGGKGTRFGAFLDSTLDRFSDFVVYAGIATYYARLRPANLTFVLLSMVAFFHAFMISYARARAEDLIESCSVGYWQRGERSAAILIASFAYNIPALIVQQAILPMLTVLRRIHHTRAVLGGRAPATGPAGGPWHVRLRLWRWPRMSVPYDIVTGLNIAWLIFAPVGEWDPLGGLLAW
ncbi:MAG TPA: CDP-alcohol phosphatidyltransferase family protein [Phycisphaerae bacterium]|nr:CDP-alcohol phosphatidyltransferase family protein [Phycisphaerae bacterium]